MYHSSLKMIFPPDKLAYSKKILKSAADRMRFDPGCVHCAVYQCFEDEHILMIEALWCSHEDLERHLRSDDYLRILELSKMAVKKPKIRFNLISNSSGLDTIEKARRETDPIV